MKFFLYVLFSICSFSVFSQKSDALDQFIKTSGFENASMGVCVKDIAGKDIISYNQQTAITPASTLKVITSATALEMLGENYKFRTVLSVDKNNPQHLIVHGYGDPTLGSEHIGDNPYLFFDTWISEIKKNIDTSKPIDITIVDNYFGYKGVSPKWIDEDLGNYFAAGAYGISIFDNSYKLYLNTMKLDTCPQILRTEPVMKDIIFENMLSLNANGKDNGYINGQPFANYRKLVGDVPAKRTSFVLKGDIPDPGSMLGSTLAEKLSEKGVKVNSVGTTRQFYYQQLFPKNKITPYQVKAFYTHYSPPLKDIIREVNVKSNNHYTEHLIRAIGCTTNPDIYSDPLAEGIMQTKLFWKLKGIQSDGLFAHDGSGLAPSNKLSPALLCDVLLYMKTQSSYANSFVASLPKAGKEGTVKNVLKGTKLEGKIILKSGSIHGVQCFAGYYISGSKQYVFAVMVNNFNTERRLVVDAIEKFLLTVF
ncbi:MAG: D-alanyl-D-alanine carboxypeptidase/D-alanyl-D-alanine-endopeptidase [Bacteroidota bacterium]|jgi:D-alanyl-D-alanine carboxypeptidase/D-alanyl-D-alanine-endopeptidase (penicillin-binding protein 4)